MANASVLVFADPAFPGYVPVAQFTDIFPTPPLVVGATELAQHLPQCEMFVSFHGAYFPKDAWSAIIAFLERGGNLAVLGGAPFTRPVRADGFIEPDQGAYMVDLGLGQPHRITTPSSGITLAHAEAATALLTELPSLQHNSGIFWACTPKLTQSADYPAELGSAGSLDTMLIPLIYATSAEAPRLATPFFLLEQRNGRFCGGRWLLSLWEVESPQDWVRLGADLRAMFALVSEGAQSCDIQPVLARYTIGEQAQLRLLARARAPLHATVVVRHHASARVVLETTLHLAPSTTLAETAIRLPLGLDPGLYHVALTYQGLAGVPLCQETGVWVWHEVLDDHTPALRLTAGRDYLMEGDAVFYVFGSTYMDSVSQRRFLNLPNPARWDHDFAAMRAAGINLIRTGLWTSWQEFVPTGGAVNEGMLRALDAFILTASQHQLQVIFTLFAFVPPAFGGENPWLDPRSLQRQQDFATLLARRYAHVATLSWDLINEPSMGDPGAIFRERPAPSYDRFEVAAFRLWLRERYSLTELQQRWRMTSSQLPNWDAVLPPTASDFVDDVRQPESRVMLRAGDYTHFTQVVFRQWAAALARRMRDAGCQTLLGVGQDESGARPAAQFHADVVDYTSTHPWWNLDALLRDLLLDKTPQTPNLAQETGVMLTRDIDGTPWRTDAENAQLLERKLYMSLACRSAGIIQWLWHTNAYMLSDNENAIGLIRADGSHKPEYATMTAFGELVQTIRPHLRDHEPAPSVWIVIPYTQWFARPSLGKDAIDHAVRALGYGCGITPQLIGEQQVATILATHPRPRAVIVPGLQLFTHAAWEPLTRYVQEGGVLVVSGMLTTDEHQLPVAPPWRAALRFGAPPQPVSRFEALTTMSQEDGAGPFRFVFGQEKIGYVRKAHNAVLTFREGAGTIIWNGLPIELSDSVDAIAHFYRLVLDDQQAAFTPQTEHDAAIYHQALALHDATLDIFVSEAGNERSIMLANGQRVLIAANGAGALFQTAAGVLRAFGSVRLATAPEPAQRDSQAISSE